MSTPFLSLVSRLLREQMEHQGRQDAVTQLAGPALCYGYGTGEGSLQQMQAATLGLLGERLQRLTCRGDKVLLAGPSMHLLLPLISGRDIQICLLQAGSDASVAVDDSVNCVDSNFLDASLDQSFDLIVLEGTVKYLDQLATLQRLRASLPESGRFLLLAEFLLDDSAIEASELPNLSSFQQLSRRLGFALDETNDFSEAARLTLDKFEADCQQWLNSPNSPLDSSEADSMLAQLQAMRSEYVSGRRCLRLFQLRYAPDPEDIHRDIEYATINEFDPLEIATLFERSFDTDFDAAVWRWKYEMGKGRCVIARDGAGGEILAHYGGAPRHIHYFGRPAVAIQVCDVMALPEVRRQYGQGSLFFKTAATFLEREIGNTVGHLLGFGFPNQKAMNIAKRLKLYEKTDDFVELVFKPRPEQSAALRVQDFDPLSDGDTLDRLWQAMQADFAEAIIGLRDADYFLYRYSGHPFNERGHYRFHQLLDVTGQVQAVTVCKRHGEDWLLMDLICPRAGMAKAIAAISCWACQQEPDSSLKFWLTRGHVDAVSSQATAVNELGIEIPCNSWNPGPPAQLLYGKWWLTAGDMDFM